MIGYFGNIVFETSDQKILTFSDFKYDAAGRWEKHSVIGKKPVQEFIGPDIDTITFTINLNGNYGVKPRDELEKWVQMVNEGTVDVLVVGTKALGKDKWSVKSVSETWGVVFNKGELFSAKVDITLEEYISDITITSTNASTVTTNNIAKLSSLSDSIRALQYDLNIDYNANVSKSGIAEQATIAALNGIQSLIVKGHKSSVVLWIQEKLINWGYLVNNQATGTYDETTLEAVIKLQKNWGRSADGVLRLETWNIFLNN